MIDNNLTQLVESSRSAVVLLRMECYTNKISGPSMLSWYAYYHMAYLVYVAAILLISTLTFSSQLLATCT